MILIKNANLQSQGVAGYKETDILLKDGKIQKIAKSIGEICSDKEVTVLDARGRLVTPGLVESHCHIGMAGPDGNHTNEIINPIQPGFRALDALDYRSKDFEAALRTGVTTVITGPGSSNLFGGSFIAIKSAGDSKGYKIFDEIRESDCKVILGPVVGGKGKAELSGKRFDAPAMFEEAGIPFGLATDCGVIPMEGLLMQACVLVKHGLSKDEAMKALTVHAAEAVDLSHRIGSIEEGKDADMVIWNVDPLETMGEAGIVIINGKIRLMDGMVIS